MNQEKHMLFMDSGIGGISILNHFLSIKSKCNIIYYADTINYPYGLRDENEIGEILYNIYLNLSFEYSIPLINIVCNTASVSALKLLRERVNIPVVGTVPAVKPASLITKKNRIGIIATPATVKLNYLPDLINRHAKDIEVFIKGSQDLVNIVEGNYSKPERDNIMNEELSFFNDKDIDVLVLGCTHYFFLKKEINDYFKNKVTILDSVEGVSNRIIDLMKNIECSFNKDRILILSKADEGTKEKYQKICSKEKDLFNKIIIEDLSCRKV